MIASISTLLNEALIKPLFISQLRQQNKPIDEIFDKYLQIGTLCLKSYLKTSMNSMAMSIFARIQELCETLTQKAPNLAKKSSESLLSYLLQGIKLIFLSDNGSGSDGDINEIEGIS